MLEPHGYMQLQVRSVRVALCAGAAWFLCSACGIRIKDVLRSGLDQLRLVDQSDARSPGTAQRVLRASASDALENLQKAPDAPNKSSITRGPAEENLDRDGQDSAVPNPSLCTASGR